MRDDFAVFILTHGRAKQQKTLNTLQKCGYTGRLFLVIDDEDEQGKAYREMYGDQVVVFSKKKIEKFFDTMTNRKEYRSVVYARNAVYAIARERNIRFAFTADDDITSLQFRVVRDNKLKGFNIYDSDALFESMSSYMDNAGLAILGFSQAGAYVGGMNSGKYKDGCQRMVSQAMLFDTEHPVMARGIFNEDLHMSFDAALSGRVVLSTMLVSITSPERTTNAGGLHDLYKDNNEYVRNFYSLMSYPSQVSIAQRKDTINLQIHKVMSYPMILSDKYRKGAIL